MLKHRRKLLYLLPLLIFLVLFILFPLEWLGLVWQPLGDALQRVFATDTQHAVGHIGLFFLLGLLALLLFPKLRNHPYLYATLLVVGLGQETFQLLFKHRPIEFDDWRDLATDIVGLLLAYLLIRVWISMKRRGQESGEDLY